MMRIMVMMFNDITGSIAQGGGGSFKDRKPIGDFGWCDHGWQSEPAGGPKGG
jgi:hypothetical protein